MPRYRYTQIGWVMLTIGLAPVAVVAALLAQRDTPELYLPLVIVIPIFAVFGSLTVTIDDRHLTARFGFGPVRKRIALAEIASHRQVRNPWYCGWGIRYVGGGWLYNVSGFDAVEIVRHDGTRVRIGTDEPNALTRAIGTVAGKTRHDHPPVAAGVDGWRRDPSP